MLIISRDQFEAYAVQIPHIFASRHAQLCAGLVRWLWPEIVVELYPHKGHTTAYVARAVQENGFGRLFVIDGFAAPGKRDQLLYNLGAVQVGHSVTVMAGDPHQVEWPPKVDMMILPAGHEEHIARAESLGASCIVVMGRTEHTLPQPWAAVSATIDNGATVWLRPAIHSDKATDAADITPAQSPGEP